MAPISFLWIKKVGNLCVVSDKTMHGSTFASWLRDHFSWTGIWRGGRGPLTARKRNHVRKQCCSVCGVDVAGRRKGRLANCCCEVGSHYKLSSPTFLSPACTESTKIESVGRGRPLLTPQLRSFILICIICKHSSDVCPSPQPDRKKKRVPFVVFSQGSWEAG